jgi:chromosome segregation ATPase
VQEMEEHALVEKLKKEEAELEAQVSEAQREIEAVKQSYEKKLRAVRETAQRDVEDAEARTARLEEELERVKQQGAAITKEQKALQIELRELKEYKLAAEAPPCLTLTLL